MRSSIYGTIFANVTHLHGQNSCLYPLSHVPHSVHLHRSEHYPDLPSPTPTQDCTNHYLPPTPPSCVVPAPVSPSIAKRNAFRHLRKPQVFQDPHESGVARAMPRSHDCAIPQYEHARHNAFCRCELRRALTRGKILSIAWRSCQGFPSDAAVALHRL